MSDAGPCGPRAPCEGTRILINVAASTSASSEILSKPNRGSRHVLPSLFALNLIGQTVIPKFVAHKVMCACMYVYMYR